MKWATFVLDSAHSSALFGVVAAAAADNRAADNRAAAQSKRCRYSNTSTAAAGTRRAERRSPRGFGIVVEAEEDPSSPVEGCRCGCLVGFCCCANIGTGYRGDARRF